MTPETDDFLVLLKCHDVDPEAACRIGGEARARFGRRPSVISRAYDRILEPALILGTIAASLSWALVRINLLTR
jgi:hypothetical protein